MLVISVNKMSNNTQEAEMIRGSPDVNTNSDLAGSQLDKLVDFELTLCEVLVDVARECGC